MRRLRTLALFAAVLGLVLVGLAASAGRPALAVGSQIRTFVASTGSDANPCTRTAPCRLFSAALAQTASGGEIVALDTAGYGTLFINQAVTVTAAPGVQAFIAPSSGNAIFVSVGTSDTVILRNLVLNGVGATNGVVYVAGGSLHIDNLSISGFTGNAIYMDLSSPADLHVADTVVRNSGSSGIYLSSFSAAAYATITRVISENNGYGVFAGDNVRVTLRDVIASRNSNVGFTVQTSTGPSQMNLEGCVSMGNWFGLLAGSGVAGGATIRVSNCSITDNGNYGIYVSSNASILSRGNNTVEANTLNGTFTTYSAK